MKYGQVPHIDVPDPAVFVDLLSLHDEQTRSADRLRGCLSRDHCVRVITSD